MGFFDEYDEGPSGRWIKAPEKNVLIENGIPIEITALKLDVHPQHGERYVATCLVPNPETGDSEEGLISFNTGTVESRDRMLKQMSEYMERDDAEPVHVKLTKQGRSILVKAA